MNRFNLVVLLAFVSGCNGGEFTTFTRTELDAADAAPGGSPGTGGAPSATGGQTATGGVPEVDAGPGGAPSSTGGAAATGGAPSTGGSVATGGVATSTGGAPEDGGTPVPTVVCCKFDLPSGLTTRACDVDAPWYCVGGQTFSCDQPDKCTTGMVCYVSGGPYGGVVGACDLK